MDSEELRDVAKRLSTMTREEMAGMLVDTRRMEQFEEDVKLVSTALIDCLGDSTA